LAIALLATVNMNASAADRPSQATLDAMGLGGMVVLDDDAALAIRGMGYKSKGGSSAHVWGSSYASISGHGGSAASENGYDAKGKKSAVGGNYSEAGLIIEKSSGGGKKGKGGDGWNPPKNGPSRKGSKGGNSWSPKSSKGGKGGGGHGGTSSVKSVKVFAGGSSFAKVH
jgi:hypothetical protein